MTTTDHVVSATAEIAAPRETVFAILADPRQHQRIDGSGSLRGALRGPEKLEQGACFGMDMKLFGLPYKIRNTVVEYVEPQQIAWRHFAGHRWRYLLEETATGTRVTEQFDYSRQPLAHRVFLEVTRFSARNRDGIEKTLQNLRSAAEADARRADTPQADTPQADTPQADTPQADTPQADTPQADTPQGA